MPISKISNEQLQSLRAAGVPVAQIARDYDMDLRTVFRKLARLKRILSIPPLAAAVPDGFEVTKLSTRLDAAGATTGQNVQVKPIPEDPEIEQLIPDGHVLKGISSFVVDGTVRAQWIKTTRDQELQHMAQQAAVAALAESVMPLPPIPLSNEPISPNLLNLYTITDAHVGALAWKRETGEAWDLQIAERVLTETVCRMIYAAPAAEVGVVNQLGDFLHFDSLVAETPTSGHALDADSRYQKMVEVAVRILETIIHAAAQKHPLVRVYCHEGNHDMAGSVWLRVLFARLFRDNPRIIVEDTPNPYPALQWGKTMLGFHHGHLSKKDSLPLKFATQHAEMWGATVHREIHTGHMHHLDVKEHAGITVRQHPTLAAKDAYSARGGYHSLRKVTCMTYHRVDGEIGTSTFLPTE